MDNTHVEKTTNRHQAIYGTAPKAVAWAPGRIEVIGNHTDYNEGTVLSAAIQMGHVFCLSKSDRPGIRIHAADLGQTAEFSLDTPGKVPDADWANYPKGVFTLLREAGLSFDGLDSTFWGTIPMGSGLSSSAALEVAAACALLGLCDEAMDRIHIAKICQRAEIEFAGCNCGLLDQFSSLFGIEHGLIHTDFRTLEVSPVKLPSDALFLMVNPHVKHRLADSPYNERRARCEQAAAELDRLIDREVRTLRDVNPAEFAALRNRIDPAAAQRAAHVIGEIDRVARSVELLEQGDLEAFGELMYQSHESSRLNFENSCPELDRIVEAARAAGAPGARLSGGGFGGSAVVLAKENEADQLAEEIVTRCKTAGLDRTECLRIIPSAGASLSNRKPTSERRSSTYDPSVRSAGG